MAKDRRSEGLEAEHGSTALPLRAKELLRILLRYRGKNAYCWPSQDLLAAEMEISVRRVKHWIAFLVDVGCVKVEKTGRVNNYFIVSEQGTKTAPQRGRKQPLRGDENSPSEGTISSPMPPAPLDELDSAAASASAAAAADQEAPGENAINSLEEIGMPAMVKPIADKSPTLALAALVHCRWRFSQGSTLKPVANQPGYIVSVLRNPEGAGFMQDDDLNWHPPPGQPPRKRANGVEHPKVMEELAILRDYMALPEATKRRIEEFVRERAPLFGPGSAAFTSACRRVMVQWRKEGKLL